jgi:hypothetical protein
MGGVCIPTFQRLFARYVESFARHRSVVRVFFRAISPAAVLHLRESIQFPEWRNVTEVHRGAHLPLSVVFWNMVAMAIWTVGVFSALYAAYLRPDLRVTSSELSAIVNGLATILMFVFIDPYLSMLTDEVADGKVNEPYFRRSIVWLTASRVIGTLAAQLLLVPAAFSIVAIAEWL